MVKTHFPLHLNRQKPDFPRPSLKRLIATIHAATAVATHVGGGQITGGEVFETSWRIVNLKRPTTREVVANGGGGGWTHLEENDGFKF